MSTTIVRNFFLVGLVALFTSSSYAQSCPGSAGCLDTTFGTGGKVTVPLYPAGSFAPQDMVTLPDGKLLALVYRNRFVRLNADGTLDQTFGLGGVLNFVWPATSGLEGYANGYDMRLQNVGSELRILVAGNRRLGTARKFTNVLQMGRFMLDGTVDTSFGTNGTVLINAATWSNEMEFQSDGKIVILDGSGKIVRTNINGSLDTGFGSGGIVNAGYNIESSGLNHDLVIDGNGGILVGDTITTGSGKNTKMLLAVKRYTSGGAVDTAFGSAGTATADFGVRSAQGGQLAVDPFGNVVVAGGVVAPDGQYYFAAARFTSNGLADTSFGGTGKVKFVGAAGIGQRGVLIQDDGKVVLTGRLNDDYGLVRYNFNGTLDTTFGNGGTVIEDVDLTDQLGAWTIQMDPGCACSKIVMSSAGSGLSFARFTVD
jgi:uncharacterized delta-60 repeat protein